MADIALDLLTGRARVALPFIEQGVNAGLGASSIIDSLASAGLTFRRTDMLSVIRQVAGIASSRPYISSLRSDLLPNPARLPQAVTITQRKYSYLVRVTGTHLTTGEKMTHYVTITSDELISKAEAIDHLGEVAINTEGSAATSFDTTTVESIRVNPLFA